MDPTESFLADAAAVTAVHIPRWDELPQFDLYMDQVIALAERTLAPLYVGHKGMLTPSMINNYVKTGVLTPPVNKKYNRTNLAMLMIICAMKPVMEISVIADVIKQSLTGNSMQYVLDEFARLYENELTAAVRRARTALTVIGPQSALSFISIEGAIKASANRTVASHAYDAVTADRQAAEEARLEQEKEAEKARRAEERHERDRRMKEKKKSALEEKRSAETVNESDSSLSPQ